MSKPGDSKSAPPTRLGGGPIVHFLLPGVIALAGLIAYHNCFEGVFLLDDQRNLVDNTRLHQLWPIGELLQGSRRPVVDVTLAINYALSGVKPAGYHAVNLGIHLVAALTLFGLVRRTLNLPSLRDRFASSPHWIAFVVGLLFVVHPLQTQAVTYIIQRSESMMGMFYLLMLYCFVRGVDARHRRAWFGLAVVCAALGMGSKAVMVTAPLAVLLFDRCLVSGSFARALRARWGLYLSLAATWGVLGAAGIIRGVLFHNGTSRATVGLGYKGIDPFAYACTQTEVLLQYLRLAVWPAPLCLDYDWHAAKGLSDVLPAALAVGVLLAGTAWCLLRRPALGFCVAWFFLILAPTSSVIPIRDPVFEHRMYLALAGVIVLAVLAGRVGLDWMFGRGDRSGARWAATALLVAATGFAGTAFTVRRNRDYRSALVMWQDVAGKQPGNSRAHCNLGIALSESGASDEALAELNRAVQIDPDNEIAQYNLASLLGLAGQHQQALAHYEKAVGLKPNYVQAWINWANALSALGRPQQAVEKYRAALRATDRRTPADLFLKIHINLGNALFTLGDVAQAEQQYRKALAIKPDHYRAHYNRAVALERLGRVGDAIDEYRQTLRLKPDHAGARSALAAAESQSNRL
ncbi:MAG: tetratricopeptide repeat protein [Phycisphaerae bacterium]